MSSLGIHLWKQKPAHPGRSRQDDRICSFRFSLLLDAFEDPGCKTASQLIQMLIPFVIVAVDATTLGNRATARFGIRKIILGRFDFSVYEFCMGF